MPFHPASTDVTVTCLAGSWQQRLCRRGRADEPSLHDEGEADDAGGENHPSGKPLSLWFNVFSLILVLPFSFSLSSPFRFGVCTMEIFLEFFCFARRAEIIMKWDGKTKSDNRMVYHNPCCPSVSRSGTAVHVLFCTCFSSVGRRVCLLFVWCLQFR